MEYTPLIDWLCATCILTSQHKQVASWDATPTPPFLMMAAIHLKTKQVLAQHLPGLYALGVPAAAPVAGTTEALQKLVTH